MLNTAAFVGEGGMPLEVTERNMKLFAAEVPHIQRGASPIVQCAAGGS